MELDSATVMLKIGFLIKIMGTFNDRRFKISEQLTRKYPLFGASQKIPQISTTLISNPNVPSAQTPPNTNILSLADQ